MSGRSVPDLRCIPLILFPVRSVGGQDSLDDNFLAVGTQDLHETLKGTAKLFNNTNDLNRHFNLYNQIDKLTNNAQILARKLETTEL